MNLLNLQRKGCAFSALLRNTLFYSVLLIAAFASTVSAQDHPNIVVILADDLGYGDVGFNGVQDIPTPNIDALAANGLNCTNAYVTEPYCAPSRAAILTGRYQQRYGFNGGPNEDAKDAPEGLPLTELTLPQLLKPAGYVCGAIGKWHLGFSNEDFYPLQRGFDEFVGFLFGKSSYYNAKLLDGNGPFFFEPEYLTDYFTSQAVSFIDNHASQPFFLYLAYNAVHDPYDVPPAQYMQRVSYITNTNRQIYAAMVVALDDGVGQVVQALQDNGILDNTLIIFLSDNGAPKTVFHATDVSNLPLRGYKLDMLEGGIRVPFAVQWPARFPAGVTFDDVISSLDIFPMAAAAAGVPLPTDRDFDGIDMTPFLAGEQASPSRTLYWRWFGLGPNGPLDANTTIYAIRDGPYKLVLERARETLPPELYKLTNDIGERKDLSKKNTAEVAKLVTLYNQWSLCTVPDLFTKDDNTYLFPLSLPGDWNNFAIDDDAPWQFDAIDAPAPLGTPDSYNWITDTIYASDSGGDTTSGDHSFAIVANNDYGTQWGGVTVNVDAETDLPAQSSDGLGPLNTISFDDGFYYSLRVINTNDQTVNNSPMQLGVMKTSAPPVTVTCTGQSPQNPTPTDPIVVSISTSATPSPEERIYVRWSNDWFITSNMIQADGSGTDYSATIPPQPAGVSVYYSVLTSTVDLSQYTTSSSIDNLTLEMNGAFNGVPALPPTISQQPKSVKVTLGRPAKFTVKATGAGPLSYRWTKNGLEIPGAISTTYQTPPAQTADNGSQYAVIVNGLTSPTVSQVATLTVRSN